MQSTPLGPWGVGASAGPAGAGLLGHTGRVADRYPLEGDTGGKSVIPFSCFFYSPPRSTPLQRIVNRAPRLHVRRRVHVRRRACTPPAGVFFWKISSRPISGPVFVPDKDFAKIDSKFAGARSASKFHRNLRSVVKFAVSRSHLPYHHHIQLYMTYHE